MCQAAYNSEALSISAYTNMPTEQFLKDFLKKYNLSDAESEAVSLVLEEKSIQEISLKLSVSENAVRKRLGEVYEKLGISGRGPGKLIKLQQMLSLQNNRRVLIWWSGSDGEHLAESLKNTIFSYQQLETKVCTLDSRISKAWRAEIEQSLDNVDIAIGCLTPGLSQKPWVNYAAGFLTGRVRNQLILFGENLSDPLTHLSSIDGTNKEELARLLQEITHSEINEAREWVKFKFPQLNKEIEQTELQPALFDGDKIEQPELQPTLDKNKLAEATDFKEAENYLKANKYIQKNVCFELIILDSVTETRKQIMAVNSDYFIPAVLYPQRLVSLQRDQEARVFALALIDHQESFWSEAIGREILDTADPDSVRVFVFTKAEDFDRNFEMLLEHASRYQVYVMNYKMLARNFKGFVRDFSVIEVSRSKVLAEYVESGDKNQFKNIRFSADEKEVAKHEDKIKKIIESELVQSMRKPLEDIISRVQQIKISNFEALQRLTSIQEEVRTSLRKKIFS